MNGQQENEMGHKIKIGSKIKLYYDGKLGRMTIGKIIEKKTTFIVTEKQIVRAHV